MNPTDSGRVKQRNPDFVIRNGAFHAWNTAAPCPILRIAWREVSDRELANGCDTDGMQYCNVGAISGPKLQRWEQSGLTKTGEPRTDGKEGVNPPNGQYLRLGKGEQNQAERVHKWVPKGK